MSEQSSQSLASPEHQVSTVYPGPLGMTAAEIADVRARLATLSENLASLTSRVRALSEELPS